MLNVLLILQNIKSIKISFIQFQQNVILSKIKIYIEIFVYVSLLI